MKVNDISVGKRLASMLLDHIIMTVIIVVIFSPFVELNSDYTFAGFIALLMYFCKDSFGGQSVAKRALKLQILDSQTGDKANALKCFVRNMFCILWPIEVLITLGNTSRRLGDRIAGTKVVSLV